MKARMEYKASFLFYIFAILTFYAGQFGLLFILLNRFHEIKGWSVGEMVFLYSLQAFAFGFTNLIFSQLVNFDKMIVDGEFDRVLVRPLSPLGQVIFSKFEVSTAAHLIIGSTALYFGSRYGNIDWTFYKVVLFPVIITGGVLIAVAFWTLRNRSLVHTVIFSSKEFINYPVNIYNVGMQFFLTFIFPIAFINFYPAHFFLDRSGTGLLHPLLEMGTPIVGLIVTTVSIFSWKAGVNHYQSTGS
jgi:ABC-2 type transport system permease protein